MKLGNKFPEEFYKYLEINTLIEIKGGTKRNKYLEIWMVNVNERIFARTWGKSERGWFSCLIEEGIGTIRYLNKVINIEAKKNNNSEINKLVDKAYLQRYNQPHNTEYTNGITQKEYSEFTVELFYISNNNTENLY